VATRYVTYMTKLSMETLRSCYGNLVCPFCLEQFETKSGWLKNPHGENIPLTCFRCKAFLDIPSMVWSRLFDVDAVTEFGVAVVPRKPTARELQLESESLQKRGL